jgi:hypothetical protein
MRTRLFPPKTWTARLALAAALAAALGLGASLRGQGGAPRQPGFKPPPTEFECRWARGPITIDGKADEEAWKHAQVIDNFYLPWLGPKARAAKTATKARLLWDREYLYFFADMEDTDLYADVKEHNGMTWENDVFELFFKPAEDKPGYYEFQVNAAGTVFDMFIPRRGSGGYRVTRTTRSSTSRPRSSCAARSTSGPTATRAGPSRAASPGRTSCAPAAARESTSAGNSPSAATITPSISRGRSCPPVPR